MCVDEYVSFVCGHCHPPSLVKCPLTLKSGVFERCAVAARHFKQDPGLCAACHRAQWEMDVLAEEHRHRAKHIALRGYCEPDCGIRFGPGVEFGWSNSAEKGKGRETGQDQREQYRGRAGVRNNIQDQVQPPRQHRTAQTSNQFAAQTSNQQYAAQTSNQQYAASKSPYYGLNLSLDKSLEALLPSVQFQRYAAEEFATSMAPYLYAPQFGNLNLHPYMSHPLNKSEGSSSGSGSRSGPGASSGSKSNTSTAKRSDNHSRRQYKGPAGDVHIDHRYGIGNYDMPGPVTGLSWPQELAELCARDEHMAGISIHPFATNHEPRGHKHKRSRPGTNPRENVEKVPMAEEPTHSSGPVSGPAEENAREYVGYRKGMGDIVYAGQHEQMDNEDTGLDTNATMTIPDRQCTESVLERRHIWLDVELPVRSHSN